MPVVDSSNGMAPPWETRPTNEATTRSAVPTTASGTIHSSGLR